MHIFLYTKSGRFGGKNRYWKLYTKKLDRVAVTQDCYQRIVLCGNVDYYLSTFWNALGNLILMRIYDMQDEPIRNIKK